MDYIKDVKKRLKALKGQLPVITREVVIKRRQDIIAYYQEFQIGMGIKKGIRKDGVFIGWYARGTHEAWIDWWGGNPPYGKYFRDPYNMEWTGDFFNGMYLFFPSKYDFEISSHDKKTPELLKSYGDLFTLTDEVYKAIEKRYIEPDFGKIFEQRFSDII